MTASQRRNKNRFGMFAALALVLGAAACSSASAASSNLQNAIASQEQMFSLLMPEAPVTATWVQTTPKAALRFLDSIDYGDQYFSQRFCACGARPAGEKLPTPEMMQGSPSVELSLVAFEHGPVAVVELSGNEFRYENNDANGMLVLGGKRVCLVDEYRASRIFVVVNLTSGEVTGRMMANPGGTTPVIDLAQLGPTHSFRPPSNFAPWPGHACRLFRIDKTHSTEQ